VKTKCNLRRVGGKKSNNLQINTVHIEGNIFALYLQFDYQTAIYILHVQEQLIPYDILHYILFRDV